MQLRELQNPIITGTASGCTPGAMDARVEAHRAVQWVTSCIQLVSIHADKIKSGDFLWELIYPRRDGEALSPRYSASGRQTSLPSPPPSFRSTNGPTHDESTPGFWV